MLAAFILLRDFTLQLIGDHDHSEKYLRYITKACHQAPRLETFTIDHGAYTIRCKRVNKNWVVCDKVKYPAPWEYVCVLSKGGMFVYDLFFRYLYLHVHERKTDGSKSYQPADDGTWNVAYVWEPCRRMTTMVPMVLATYIQNSISLATSRWPRASQWSNGRNLSARTKSRRPSVNHSRSCQSGQPRHHVPGQQDVVLARKMFVIIYVTHSDRYVRGTLAESTHLARKVRTYNSRFNDPDLASALRNMTSLLRSEISRLKECTFKLYSLTCFYPYDKYLRRFLNSQPSIKQ